jgi:DNA-binding NarL/FixJ family response regulator
VSIRVLLVDDQSLLRLGFRMVLEAQPDIEVVGEAGDGATAVAMTRSRRCCIRCDRVPAARLPA